MMNLVTSIRPPTCSGSTTNPSPKGIYLVTCFYQCLCSITMNSIWRTIHLFVREIGENKLFFPTGGGTGRRLPPTDGQSIICPLPISRFHFSMTGQICMCFHRSRLTFYILDQSIIQPTIRCKSILGFHFNPNYEFICTKFYDLSIRVLPSDRPMGLRFDITYIMYIMYSYPIYNTVDSPPNNDPPINGIS